MSLLQELQQFTKSNQCYYQPKPKNCLSEDEKQARAMDIYEKMDDGVYYHLNDLVDVWSRSTTYKYLKRLVADGLVECKKIQQGQAYRAMYRKTDK